MLRYVLLRLLGAIPTLLLVIVLAFLMVHAAPGGPFDEERVLPAEVAANIEAAYHLDEPLPQQFWGRLIAIVTTRSPSLSAPAFRCRCRSALWRCCWRFLSALAAGPLQP